jgi:CheY-like chemotaxis protein
MKKIVVAEGSPTIKSVADSVLRQNGYDVVCTSDGLQAWEVISAEKPDLVLSGLGLSGISGLELCRQIAKDNLTGGVPIVLMIGPKDPISDEEILASGARGKLRKPFSPKELLEVVGKLTGNPQEQPKPSNNIEPTTDLTKFSAQVSSTQHLKEKSDGVKLDWLDLNDSAPSIKKIVSLDINSDEQQLIIEDDQYGLSRQHSHNAQESGLKDKDDYDWFIGEMKRDIENKPRAIPPAEIAESKTTPINIAPLASTEIDHSSDKMHFGDIHSSPESEDPPKQMASLNSPGSTIMEIDSQSSSLIKGFSEEELALVVDRVVARLTSQIIATIDRNQIMEAIKATIKT